MNVLDGDLLVRGTLQADDLALPNNAVGDAQVSAARPLGVTKQIHQYSKQVTQPHGTSAVDYRGTIHSAYGAGTILAFQAKVSVIPVGAATVTVDLYKNGVSVLSGVITIDNANLAFTAESATLSTPTYAAGDELEAVVNETTGGGTPPQGLSILLIVSEAAQ